MRELRELHVIVKEEDVRMVASTGNDESLRALSELESIKKNKEFLEIKNSASELHPQMPPPGNDLRVWVSGGFKYLSCTLQLHALRLAGYEAYFHPTACPAYVFTRLAEPHMLPRFKELVPEYYEN